MSLRALSDAALADRYDAVLMPGGVFLQSGRQFTRAEFEAWLAHGGPSVPDPVSDTARALAGLYAQACDVLRPADDPMSLESEFKPREAERLRAQWGGRKAAIADAARACGPQVEAAFNALLTGDATRAPGVGDA